MNFLAHAYLSFEDPAVLTGNLISDFVKGKKKFDYPAGIQDGISLHRAIDAFTDGHETTKKAARLFKPAYGLYGLAFMDIVYDHFLALELSQRRMDFFNLFTASVYEKVEQFEEILPPAFKSIFPHMKQHNWLYNYQFIDGIEKSFEGVVRRAMYISESRSAMKIFNENYEQFQEAYNNFFPDVLGFSLEKFADIH